jgi:hypothetical protein
MFAPKIAAGTTYRADRNVGAAQPLAYTTMPYGVKNYVRMPRGGQSTWARELPEGLDEDREDPTNCGQ